LDISKSQVANFVRNNIAWSIVACTSVIFLVHFTNANNDYRVFVDAGLAFRKQLNPWAISPDPNSMYLNGASGILPLVLFSFLKIETGLFLLRLLNLTVVVLLIWKPRNYSMHKVTPLYIALVMLSFPFRSAMEYGQLTVLYSSLAFWLVSNLLKGDSYTVSMMFSLVLLIDYKPHVFVFLLLVLLVKRKYLFLSQAFLFWAVIQLLIGWWTKTVPIVEWYKAIQYRNQYVTSGEDSFSLVSILNLSPLVSMVVTGIGMTTLLIVLVKHQSDIKPVLVKVSVIGLLAIPLLHPTDLLLVFLFFLASSSFKQNELFILGFFFIWSPLVSGFFFTCVMCSLVLFLLRRYKLDLSWKMIALFLLPNISYFSLVQIGVEEVLLRHSMQFICLALLLVIKLDLFEHGFSDAKFRMK